MLTMLIIQSSYIFNVTWNREILVTTHIGLIISVTYLKHFIYHVYEKWSTVTMMTLRQYY